MALVADGLELLVDLVDNGGNQNRRVYKLVETDITAVDAVVADMLTKIGAVTDSVVSAYRVAQVFVEDALVYPASGVQNENQALISAKIIGNPRKSGTLSIPGAKPAIFNATSGKQANIVNMGNAAILAYVRMFDSGHGDEAYISDGEFIDASTASGRRRHTKNNSG